MRISQRLIGALTGVEFVSLTFASVELLAMPIVSLKRAVVDHPRVHAGVGLHALGTAQMAAVATMKVPTIVGGREGGFGQATAKKYNYK